MSSRTGVWRQPVLHPSRLGRRVRDLPELLVIDAHIGSEHRERRMIEHIQRLHAQLDIDALGQLRLFEQRGVHGEYVGTGEHDRTDSAEVRLASVSAR